MKLGVLRPIAWTYRSHSGTLRGRERLHVTIKGRYRPRVLVLGLEGGFGHAALLRNPDFEIALAGSFRLAFSVLARFKPDVTVVTLEASALDDIVEFRAFVKASRAPALVLSWRLEERRITEFIKAGASGFLLADDVHRAPQAVRELLDGGTPMSASVSRLVLGRARRSSAKMAAVLPRVPPCASARLHADESPLTPRQREILKLLAQGHSYEDIARTLDVSVNTVRTHVRTIYERLGASTRVEAVMAGIELRLFDHGR